MARALIQQGPVRSVRRLSRVRGFGRRRRTHLRVVLTHAALEGSLSSLLHTLTDTCPDTPPIVKRHPLGPDAQFAPSVGPQLLAVPVLVAEPPIPDVLPSGHPQVLTFRAALRCPSLPSSLIIIGGGYAGTELCWHWLGQGHRVSIIHSRRHLLAGNLPAVAERIHDEVVSAGAVVLTDAEVIGWRSHGDAIVIVAETWDGEIAVVGDLVVVAD
jgi:NADPH-dependent 2,4-dienoyl-CoA reductase/sulfur reductase-like enzyme